MNEAETLQTGQYLTFKLEEEIFALGIDQVREVLEFDRVTKVPQTPDMMRGVINLRGSVVPVIDLKLKFGMGETAKQINTCVVIVELNLDGETTLIGALADSVQEVIDLEENQIEPPPKIGTRLNTELIRGMGKRNEDFIMILEIEKVFTLNELEMLQDAVEVN
jgi:purine-binding chemotaxis protein CheW